MAGDGGGKATRFESSVFYPHIETNTRVKPHVYYNLGVYVTLYNRIRGDLQNNFDGDLSTFDTVINEKIKEGLTGSRAEVEAFLDQYGYKGMIKLYDDGVVNSDTKSKIKKDDYDYMVSNHNILDEFDKTVALARELTRVKYSSGERRAMLTYDDAREIMHIKEEKSDKTFYELSRSMTSNAGGFNSKGEKFGGILNQAMRTADDKLKGFKKNRRLGFWKAVGWAALTVGAAAVTGGLGFATLGLGGQALGGLFGTLYTTTGAAGAIGGVIGTGVAGYGTVSWFGRFLGRISANIKLRKKYRDFKYSRGKYAEADYNEFDKMGHKRLKMLHDEHVALKKFYDNYSKGVLVTKRRKGEPQAIDYVPKEYRKAFLRYLEKEEIVGANARSATTLMTNAKHHRFVANQDLKEGEFGYYNLYRFMNRGVEGYETSTLTPDEVILNYGTEVTSGTGAKPRLHKDVIREHKGYPDELSYLTAKLNEFVAYEETFKKGSQMGEFAKGLERFVSAYNTSFAGSLFESPYDQKMIGNAQNIMESPQFKKMIEQTNSGEIDANLKGVLSFLAAERDNISEREPKQLSDAVGVGVEHQFDMSKDSMVAGCAGLGDSSDAAREAAEAIAAMIKCSTKFVDGSLQLIADPVVVSKVNATSDPAKTYLKHMLEVKLSQCQINGNETLAAEGAPVSTILTKIYGLTKSDKAAEIRKKIAEDLKDLDTDAIDVRERKAELRKQLSDVLDAQILSIETKVRDDSKVAAIKGIKAGSTKFAELLEEIKKIETVETTKIQELMHKIEMQAQRPELVEYLKLRVKDKVVHELKYFANNSDNFAKGSSEENLKELMAFIRKISSLYSSGCLDQWQFDSLMSTLSIQIERTMNAYLYDVEKLFLENTDEKINALNKLLTLPAKEGQGLKEFFEMNTPESIEIWNKADIYRQGLAVRDFMTMTSTGSYGGFVDSKSGDIQTALNIYFSKYRGATDNLRNIFSMIDGNINQMDYNQDIDYISAMPEKKTSTEKIQMLNDDGSYTEVDIPEFEGMNTCKKIIGTGNITLPDKRYSFVMSAIETLKSDSFKNATHEERLAALTVLKRKIAGMMRVQMIQLFLKKGAGAADYTDFYKANRTDLNNNLINGWKDLAQIVDDLIVACKNNLPAGSMVGNTIEPNTVRIVNSICQPTKYSTIVNQQQMMG